MRRRLVGRPPRRSPVWWVVFAVALVYGLASGHLMSVLYLLLRVV